MDGGAGLDFEEGVAAPGGAGYAADGGAGGGGVPGAADAPAEGEGEDGARSGAARSGGAGGGGGAVGSLGGPGLGSAGGGAPGLYRAVAEIAAPGDAALELTDWTRGFVWVNGFRLGRCWSAGPQESLFVPGPVLRAGSNEVWVLELERGGEDVRLG